MIDVQMKSLPSVSTSSSGTLTNAKTADTEMHIDEEGLPQFKPASASVCVHEENCL